MVNILKLKWAYFFQCAPFTTPERKPPLCFVFALSAPHKATANLAGHYLAALCLTLYGEPCAR